MIDYYCTVKADGHTYPHLLCKTYDPDAGYATFTDSKERVYSFFGSFVVIAEESGES